MLTSKPCSLGTIYQEAFIFFVSSLINISLFPSSKQSAYFAPQILFDHLEIALMSESMMYQTAAAAPGAASDSGQIFPRYFLHFPKPYPKLSAVLTKEIGEPAKSIFILIWTWAFLSGKFTVTLFCPLSIRKTAHSLSCQLFQIVGLGCPFYLQIILFPKGNIPSQQLF